MALSYMITPTGNSKMHVFPSGLRLVYHPSQGAISHCGIMIGTGTRHEPSDKNGLAHFIEHVIFKGTRKRTAYQVLNRLESVGGDLNAYTTKEETCIHASLLHEHFERAVELLSDIVFNPSFPNKEVEVERGVVLDEINSYLDNPSEQIFDDFECMVFKGLPLGNPILGTADSVKSFHRNDLLKFTKANYTTDRMVFSYVGDLSFEEVKTCVARHMNAHRKSGKEPASQKRNPSNKNVVRVINRHTAHDHFICGGKAYAANSNKRFGLFLLNNILGGPGMSSRLNMNIREKHGYTYHIESGYHTFSDTGLFHIYFATESGFFDKCHALVRKELDKLMRDRISSSRMAMYQYQLKGQIALGQENRAGYMLNNARNMMLYGKPMDLQQVMRKIDALTPSDLMEIANELFAADRLSALHYKRQVNTSVD